MSSLASFVQATKHLPGVRWDPNTAGTVAVATIGSEMVFNMFKKDYMEDFEVYRSERKKTLFFRRTADIVYYRNEDRDLFIKLEKAVSSGASDIHRLTVSTTEQ